jgi:threonine/homoserine/homoserine lactone efflux protein
MTLTNLLIGLTIGLPVMLAVGPIAVLLLDQGLERGIRIGAPAVAGVAAADLTLSIVSATAGATVSSVLAPWTTWLTAAAIVVLMWLAWDLGRSAWAELGDARRLGVPGARTEVVVPVELIGAGAPGARAAPGDGPVALEPGSRRESGLLDLSGMRLVGAFYGLTLVNPLTVVLFASLVVAGGAGVGTAGWAIGMALASLLAHGSFLVVGGLLGKGLGPVATARLRLGAALFMAALALHFLAGI